MNERILIVEDEPSIARRLEDDLTLEEYRVVVVDDGVQAAAVALAEDFDLMLLDVMLPGRSGYDVCREVRKTKPQLPIIMLTAKSHEAEKVLGLDVGADDYVTKPFSPVELRARIRALLRRTSSVEQAAVSFGPITVDLHRVEIRKGDDRLEFTALEFKIIAALVQNQGRVIGRDGLLDMVWGPQVVVTDRAIDTHIANIRKKLGAEAAGHIETVRGMGYRFIA